MTFDAVKVGDTFIDTTDTFWRTRHIEEILCGTEGKTLVLADNGLLYYIDNSEVQ